MKYRVFQRLHIETGGNPKGLSRATKERVRATETDGLAMGDFSCASRRALSRPNGGRERYLVESAREEVGFRRRMKAKHRG